MSLSQEPTAHANVVELGELLLEYNCSRTLLELVEIGLAGSGDRLQVLVGSRSGIAALQELGALHEFAGDRDAPPLDLVVSDFQGEVHVATNLFDCRIRPFLLRLETLLKSREVL